MPSHPEPDSSGEWVLRVISIRSSGTAVRLFGAPPVGGAFVFVVRTQTRNGPLSSFERERRVRVNRQIRISPVRVVTAEGEQLGVLPIEEAMAAAVERGLDLVEVAPMARPPVVKIMDYGKFKFEEAKAARAAKKKQHVIP